MIHSAVRMFLGKCRVQRRRFDTCARHIQSLWRGSRARCIADRTWLESVVIPIQKQARGMRSRSRYAKIREEVYAATLRISRCYRGYSGRRDRNKALYERESGDLRDLLALLGSEAQAMQDRAKRTEKRITKKNLRAKRDAARDRVDSLWFAREGSGRRLRLSSEEAHESLDLFVTAPAPAPELSLIHI